jgi:hypothetical protein
MTNNTSGRTFLIRFKSLRPDDETIRNLRWLLKKALRQCWSRCIDVKEEKRDERR